MHESTELTLELLDTHREPITGPIGDVHSNAFTTAIGINPLIAAAMPLLAYVSELEYLEPSSALTLSEQLKHEVKAFENSAHKNGYRSQMILAARYLLCALIDEFVVLYQPHLKWADFALLKIFQHECYGGERFFIILERSFEDPHVYIDLLELGYICLSLGYKGKYKQPAELRELGLFIDQLYQVIELKRGEGQPALKEQVQCKPLSRWRLPPWWAMALSCGIVLAMVFIPYTQKLNKAIKPLIYNINHYE